MLRARGDSESASPNATFVQALAAKSLETVRLTEALSISPEDEEARAALAGHLSELRESAAQLGLVHLEAAVGEALSRLERESFGPASLVAARVLAWRYESLAGLPSHSGTHPIASSPSEVLERVSPELEPLTRLEEALRSEGEARGDLQGLGVSGLLRATRRSRVDAKVVLQDPWSLFDLELYQGRIVRVTRTAVDGAVTEGAAAFPALIGMSSGRFVVTKPAAREAGEVLEPDPGHELNEPEIQQDSPPVNDPLERENVRAQSAVAMHREPANQAPEPTHPVWRLNAGSRAGSGESGSGFGMEMQTTPRVLGFGFIVLLAATVAFLIWGQARQAGAPAMSPGGDLTPPQEPTADLPTAAPSPLPGGLDLSAFAGNLRASVDPSLEVAEGQGVLEVIGPSDVSIEVDGADQGALPVTVVLSQGRHTVRYRIGSKSTYRFYYVKSGATRALSVVTQAGGLVDAR